MAKAIDRALWLAAVAVLVGAVPVAQADHPDPTAILPHQNLQRRNTSVEPGVPRTCRHDVSFTLGKRSAMGWIGGEMVSLMRVGESFFGFYKMRPVRLHLSGTSDRGYWLQGKVGSTPVRWELQDQWAFGKLRSCEPGPKNLHPIKR